MEPDTDPRRPASTVVLAVFGWLFVVAVVGGAAVAFLSLRDSSGEAEVAEPRPTAPEPGVTPTGPPVAGTPSPTPATTTPPAESTDTRDFDALADEVSDVRGLPADEPLNAEVVSDEVLASVLAELVDEEIDPDVIASDQRLLAALRLLPADLDLVALLNSLYEEEVIGLYVPEDQTLYVQAEEESLSPLEEVTAAHEIQHALQDQAFDLEAFQEIPDVESDAALARQALVEGDAVLTQQLWSLEYQDQDEQAQVLSESLQQIPGEVLTNAPPYLREGFVFPYQQGALFVQELVQSGGLDALDAAFGNPPTTTEQILRPEKYLAGEGAAEAAVQSAPGEGWTAEVEYTFGEFDVDHLLRPVGIEDAARAAQGWGGGTVRSWINNGQVAVAGRLVFDTPQDATEACEAFARWYGAVEGGGQGDPTEGIQGTDDAYARTCTDTEVRFGLAPDTATAVALAR